MAEIIMYTTGWCGDCRRAKLFLRERNVVFREVDVDEDPDAEDLLRRVNDDRRKVPTFEVNGRYFSCSPFDPYQLSRELNIPVFNQDSPEARPCALHDVPLH
jgi:glutaredoxin